jgi:predicted PurR-regulated permease PerM
VENVVLKKWTPTGNSNGFRLKRLVSRLIAFTVFIGLFVLVIAYILPEIIVSTRNLITSTVNTLPQLQRFITDSFFTQELILAEDINTFVQDFLASFQSLVSVGNILGAIVSSTVNFANTLLNLLLGVMIAFYMLGSKEAFASYCTKIIYLMTNPERAKRIVECVREANKVFESFFVSKAIDSIIIGLLCFIMLSVIKPPYVLLFSVIIGVANMIPYFGPFIGSVPVILITLIYDQDLVKTLWVALGIFVLQQFDGIILEPKILGESTGLSPIWVIFAILIGGAMFGPLGMLLGVPCLAVIKVFLDNFINRKFDEKYKLNP